MRRGWVFMACALAGVLAAGEVAAAPRTVNDGVYSAAQAKRGGLIYGAECARCHGPALAGGGGPTLAGPFWTVWEGRSVGDLVRLTKKSMPADGPGKLSDQEYTDIVAFMLSANRYRDGKSDLPTQVDALKAITILKRQ